MAKCMVRWENQGEWRGPFEVYRYGEDWVKLAVNDSCYPTTPRAWTLGIDDGWTIWEGGEHPVLEQPFDVMLEEGSVLNQYSSFKEPWGHERSRIVAYRIVRAKRLQPLDHEPKTLDQAWDEEEPSLAAILNDWWLGDDNVFKRVDAWDVESSEAPFHLWLSGFVSRDWFTGRRHLTSDELADEMEG